MEVEVTGTNDPFMQNITRVCDLNTMHPEGTDPALVDCPQTLGQPKCVRYQDSPGETSLPPEITTDTLKEFTSPENNKDDQNTANGSGKRSKNGASSRGMETMIVTLLCGALVLVL
ncbi:uncharacterized protein LOC135470192 [Liolophura sinensis]|uniref:uncharacterized protein LOC135470192 n=1 Tax=Liolophura sinensis TaxID=3198878 RepID=UPI0031589DF9